MSWRPSHDWTEGAALPALAAGVVIISARLATCAHCHTLRVVDEGTGEETFIRRASKESERVASFAPPCLAPSPFVRVGEPLERPASTSVHVPPATPAAPVEPLAVPQLGLW